MPCVRLRCACYLVVALSFAPDAAAQVPIDGFLPLVGIGLTNEFDDDFNFFPTSEIGTGGGALLGAGGQPHFDVALLDTGAGFSLLTSQAFDDFGLGDPSPGERDGYTGTEFVTIGGATGQLDAPINDPFGLYASGLQDRSGAGAQLTMNTNILRGQTNTATITFPPDSPLPNVLGLPFAGQYATSIRSDSPQVFQLGGKTIRTPAIEFLPLGSGGGEITRKAPLNLNPGAAFVQPPAYLPNIANFDIDSPQENPTTPTLTQGGLFLNVTASNGKASLGQREFFFDTGASVTVVSQLNALSLGFDVLVDEPEFTVSVVGSGGVADNVPGFFVDEITLVALGGSITANDVPVLVLDVADPSDPGNIVEGIVGTNLLARRNVVVDPNPSVGGGGESAGVYISDPVTTDLTWATTAPSALWGVGVSWDVAAAPDLTSVTRVEHVAGGDQRAEVVGEQQAWEIFASGGEGGERVTIAIGDSDSLITFSGTTLEAGAVIEIDNGVLDTQYLDIRGGELTGAGEVRTGSGPIAGQVEVVSGVVAPGVDGPGMLVIGGRYSHDDDALLEIELGGLAPGLQHDQLMIDGAAALRGDLVVSLVDTGEGVFTPSVGDEFTVLTYDGRGGEFGDVTLPEGYVWDVRYTAAALILEVIGGPLPGDFNADGVVDLIDYTVWRDGYDEYTPADYNHDGVINVADFTVWRDAVNPRYTLADYETWRNNVGATSAVAIPEPVSLGLLLVGSAALRTGRGRSR